MNDYDRLQTLVMCSGELLASQIHRNFTLRNNYRKICSSLYFYLPTWGKKLHRLVHSKLCSITPVATKVYVILQSFVVLTWMHVTI